MLGNIALAVSLIALVVVIIMSRQTSRYNREAQKHAEHTLKILNRLIRKEN